MTATIEWALLSVGVVAGIVNLAGVWASILDYADYYPLGDRDWKFYAFWGQGHLLNGTLVGLAYLQFGTLGLPSWALVVGAVLFLVGFAIAIVAAFDLGIEKTQGMKGELRTEGWYRYSRNPQYVGYVAATVGYPLLTGSPFVVPLCGFYLLWWVSFPLAEEPWLREQFGEEYDRYTRRVPRFVGRHTVRELAGWSTDSA